MMLLAIAARTAAVMVAPFRQSASETHHATRRE
jgi:hypothetical protein